MLLYLTLGLCAGFAGALVWRYDLYEREPWPMLLVAAAAGFGVMALAGPLEGATLDGLGLGVTSDVAVSAVAATHEELARLVVVALLALLVRKQFNDPMDGIIYGSIVGLGMAIEESVFYVRLWGVTGPLPPASEPVRFCGHLIMGGITGYAVGLARMGLPRWPLVLAGCLAGSMTLHFLWDWLAFAARRAGAMAPWQTAAAIALMLGGMVVYGALVVRGVGHSQRLFSPDERRSLLGWPFRTR